MAGAMSCMLQAALARSLVDSPEQAPCALALRNAILMPMSATTSTTGSSLTDPHQRTALHALVQAGEGGKQEMQKIARRARIVLLAAEGYSLKEIARRLGVSTCTASEWRTRFRRWGLAALSQPRCNPPPRIILSAGQRNALKKLAEAGSGGDRSARNIGRRAVAILLAADGQTITEICRELSVAPIFAATWFQRFAHLGVEGIAQDKTDAPVLQVTATQRRTLQRLIQAGRHGNNQVDRELAVRAGIILLAAEGKSIGQIMRQTGARSGSTVAFWRERFARQGLEGIVQYRRSASPPLPVTPAQRATLIQMVKAARGGDDQARKLAQRARIVLLAAEGKSQFQTARDMGISLNSVWRWRWAFARLGLSGITPQRNTLPHVTRPGVTALPVSPEQSAELHRFVEAGEDGNSQAQSTARRARIILLAAAGKRTSDIARELKIDAQTVSRWRGQFTCWGVRGLTDMRRTQVSAVSARQIMELKQLVKAGESDDPADQMVARRARAILLSAEGKSQRHISRELGASTSAVWDWLERFARLGMPGITSRSEKTMESLPVSASQRQVLSRLASQPREAP